MPNPILRALSALPIVATLALAQPAITPSPAFPSNLQITTFATGLSFPYGVYQLPSGIVLAATTSGSLVGSELRIVRMTQSNGVAGAISNAFVSTLPGPATALTGVGDIVAVASGTGSNGRITLLRADAQGALTQIGQLAFTFPPSFWWHDSHSIALRAVPGSPNGYELVFNIGSEFNDTPDVNKVTVSGLASGTLNGSSLYSLPLTITGNTVLAGAPRQIAGGLRNAFGIGFAANGDVYFGENGIDFNGTNVPVSTDYFGRIPAGTSGVLDFGFPSTYYDPNSGATVGPAAGITPPVAKFLPRNGMAMQGVGGLAMAPAGFLGSLNPGAFVGFFGNRQVGVNNTLDGVAYVDLVTGQYQWFLPNSQNGVTHPVSMFAAPDGLHIADFSDLAGSNNGTIYRVSVSTVPEPSTVVLVAVGTIILLGARRRQRVRRV